jgi:hypothetical protein
MPALHSLRDAIFSPFFVVAASFDFFSFGS